MVSIRQTSRFAAGRRNMYVILASAFIALSLFCGAALASTVDWVDIASLEKESKAADKPRMIYFYSNYCPYCAKMEKETFGDERVSSYLKEHFVVSRVDTQKEQDLAIKYRVRAVPTTVFIYADGTPIDTLPGYIDANIFIWMLKYIGTKEIQSVSFPEFLKKNGVDHPMAKID